VAAAEKKLHVEAEAKRYARYSGPRCDHLIAQQIDWYRTWL